MVRQAHTYLVGAMSGATLIAIAIAAFVLLVSAQVFRDWPLAALGDGESGQAQVSNAHEAAGPGGAGNAAEGASSTSVHAGGNGAGAAGSGSAARSGGGSGALGQAAARHGGGAGGGGEGSPPPRQQGSPRSPAGSGGGGSGGSGGGGGSGSQSSTSGQLTETVNSTVNGVDEGALGGTLHESGVTEVTEGLVNGVAGPESTVGHVVDETVGTVGGLLGGNR